MTKNKMKKQIKMTISDAFIAFNQIVVYLIFSRAIRFFFRANRKTCASIYELKKGALIVANHQSVLDPFVIGFHLPWKSFLNVIPLRFPTAHKYYVWLPFLALVGSYDIGKDKRGKMLGLFRTRQYLADGKSVMLFPEGKICRTCTDSVDEFQEGITFLTDVTKNVMFVKMNGFHRRDWLKAWTHKRALIFGEIQNFMGDQKDPHVLRQCMDELSI